eukprot:scaffold2419_cov114-Isochrysis_galbana.AAC.11
MRPALDWLLALSGVDSCDVYMLESAKGGAPPPHAHDAKLEAPSCLSPPVEPHCGLLPAWTTGCSGCNRAASIGVLNPSRHGARPVWPAASAAGTCGPGEPQDESDRAGDARESQMWSATRVRSSSRISPPRRLLSIPAYSLTSAATWIGCCARSMPSGWRARMRAATLPPRMARGYSWNEL